MKYLLRFRGHAQRDVDAAFNWYADIDDRIALGFLRSLDAILARIGEAPLAYQVWPGKAVRRVPMDRFPYLVVYSVHETIVTVIAVVHTSRNPIRWLDRE